MLFNSQVFLVFICVVLLIYYRLSHRGQNRFLLLASYLFYGWWDYRFVGLIIISTVVDYLIAKAIEASNALPRRRRLLFCSIFTNLGILVCFKYFGFFAESLTKVASAAGWEVSPFTLNVILPVGISFYTFQTLSYTIDIYRGRLKACTSYLDFSLYVCFFPQLVAGPIERAGTLIPQLCRPRTVSKIQLLDGSWLILLGFVKKLVIADQCAIIVDYGFGEEATGNNAIHPLILGYLFAFQIYGDFSGYSDIARGTSRLLGVELCRNFGAPYLVSTISSLWRHWHISLSSWLRDYLYIPLGGSRLGELATYRNLMVTMMLGGLWHGAGWAYILWGLYHGALLAIERATGGRKREEAAMVFKLSKGIVIFHLVVLGWIIFRLGGTPDSIATLKNLMLAFIEKPLFEEFLVWGRLLILMAFLTFLLQYHFERIERFSAWCATAKLMGATAAFCLLASCGEFDGGSFIYFQF